MQDCNNSNANVLELLQSCTKPSIYSWEVSSSTWSVLYTWGFCWYMCGAAWGGWMRILSGGPRWGRGRGTSGWGLRGHCLAAHCVGTRFCWNRERKFRRRKMVKLRNSYSLSWASAQRGEIGFLNQSHHRQTEIFAVGYTWVIGSFPYSQQKSSMYL